MIKCYVINLDRSKDRLEYITRIFNERGLDFERVAAVDGALLSEEEANRLTAKSTWQPKLTVAEIGCFLSHRECLRRIAEGKESWAAVFEDDALFSPNIISFLQKNDWISNSVDIIKLDTHKTICTLSRRKIITIYEEQRAESREQRAESREQRAESREHYYCARLLSKHYGACGYIISRQCANKLLYLIQDITAPIDVIYFDPNHGLLHQLNIQQVIPAPVIQSGMTSTIGYSKKNKYNISLKRRVIRESKRIYRKHILSTWQALMHGYYTGKIPFK